MSNATAAAPARATKTPARAKTTTARNPAHPPTEQISDANTATLSERSVASTGATLLAQAVALINGEEGSHYGATLLELGHKVLLQLSEGTGVMGDPQASFNFAASACKGALAIEFLNSPDAVHRKQLISTAFDLLENASTSYDATLHPCVEAAAAIEAGARQFRDRPSPPIRRVKDGIQPHGITHQQLVSVCEVAAGNLATLDQLLMLAQRSDEAFDTSVIIDAAHAIARHVGGMVDTAAGESILGGHNRWNFGPLFAELGKAGEA